MEENNPWFGIGHVGMDGDDVDAGFAQRLEGRSQFIFSDGEVAIDHGILVTTGKCCPSVHPHCIIKVDTVDPSRASEGELDRSLIRFTASLEDLV